MKSLINKKRVLKNNGYFYYALDKDFNYREYKQIAFGKKKVKQKIYGEMKNTYDSLIYLMDNKKTFINREFLSRWLYLIDRNIDNIIINKLINIIYKPRSERYFSLIDDLKDIYEIKTIEEETRLKIIYQLIIYLDYRYKEMMMNIKKKDVRELIFNIKNNKSIQKIILKTILNQKPFDINYYKNLEEIDLNKIITTLQEDKDKIKEEYKIEGISLYGSIVNNEQRFTSDIDMIISFSSSLSYLEKIEKVKRFKEYCLIKLKRYVDILEINENIPESLLSELENTICVIERSK